MATYVRRPAVSSTQVEGETILVDHTGSAMITLNTVGGVIWSELETAKSLEQLVGCCQAMFPTVDGSTIASDTEAFLKHVIELDLVTRDS